MSKPDRTHYAETEPPRTANPGGDAGGRIELEWQPAGLPVTPDCTKRMPAIRCIVWRVLLGSALALLSLAATQNPALAQGRTILLDGSQERYDLREYVDVLADHGYTIEEVSSPQFADTFTQPGPEFHPGLNPDGYWMRFTVQSAFPERHHDWCLHLTTPLMREFVLYSPTEDKNGNKGWGTWHAGYANPKRTTWEGEPFIATGLDLPESAPHLYYIFYKSENTYYDPQYIATWTSYIYTSRTRNIIFYGITGFSIALILYNLFLFISLRDKTYIWYVLQSSSMTIYYYVVADFYAEVALIPWKYLLIVNYGMLGLFFVFSSLFVKSFLKTKKNLPKFHKILNAITLLSVLIFFLPFVTDMAPIELTYSIWIFILYAIYMLSGLLAWRDGERSAKFYILAWVFFGCGLLVSATATLLELKAMSNYFTMLQSSNALEMLFLSLALADRISVIRQERRAAEAVSRAKSAFLASVSHEIRTPINAIMGMNELMLRSRLDPEQSRNLAVARDASEHLLRIVNDILDFSKIEAGKLELEHVDFDLHATLRSALDVVRAQAEQKGLELSLDIAPGVPEVVKGDPFRLRQVLLNLLGNAIKFTDRGSVRLQAVMDGDAVALAVADTGVGIPQEKLETIFEGFTQADGSMARRFGGTGLGLTISQQIAGLMGGRIQVESAPGAGSVFRFTVRFAPGDPARVLRENLSSRADGLTGKALRVLVAEDNLNNTRLVKAILDRTPHLATYVSDGRAALAALRRGGFDVVLLDLEMPEVSGLEATRAIRRGEAGDPGVPIVALTAHALDEVRHRCFEAGMNGFITKPFKVDTLLDAIAAAGAGQPVTAESEAPPADIDGLPAFDEQEFRALFGHDDALCDHVRSAFLAELPDQVEAVESALERKDFDALVKAAHYFKTSVSVIGARRIAALASRVEEAAVRKDGDGAAAPWQAIRHDLAALKRRWEQG